MTSIENTNSSTKNTKDNRKVVRAIYEPQHAVFKIPDGIDLENKNVVNYWYVKWANLYICYVDGRKEEIESENDPYDFDFERPDETDIQDAEDCYVEYSEDEEEEEEDVPPHLQVLAEQFREMTETEEFNERIKQIAKEQIAKAAAAEEEAGK